MQHIRDLQKAARHFEADRLFEAEEACRSVIELDPDIMDAVHLLALIRRKQGNLDEAEALFQTCISKLPGRADIRANYGNLLRAESRTEEAIEQYRHALAANDSFMPRRGRLMARHAAAWRIRPKRNSLTGGRLPSIRVTALRTTTLVPC
jgi:Tfp pilus assembly protein PilF